MDTASRLEETFACRVHLDGTRRRVLRTDGAAQYVREDAPRMAMRRRLAPRRVAHHHRRKLGPRTITQRLRAYDPLQAPRRVRTRWQRDEVPGGGYREESGHHRNRPK